MKIRTLGLYQPYAGLMLHGKIETRWVRMGKTPPFPLGDYVIYSTQKAYKHEEFKEIVGSQYNRAYDLIICGGSEFHITGHIIAKGTLYAIERMVPELCKNAFVEPPADKFYKETGTYIDKRYDPITGQTTLYTLWAMYFKKVLPVEPFPFKGKQGVGFLSPEDEAKIKLI
jgi:hypothetical protein